MRVPGATRYLPTPPELTDAAPATAMPVPLCLIDGHPVLCDWQLVLALQAQQAQTARCEAGLGAVATLTAAGDPDGR